MTGERWLQKNTGSLTGKTVAVSGATGGLGRHLCRYLAQLGADLVLLDRNRDKSAALRADLQKEFPGLSVTLITMDLEDMSSVFTAAERLEAMPLHALVLNAGAYAILRKTCDTGLDNVFQINFAAPYYLARRLKPHLKKCGGRVVAVGSIAHTYSKTDMRDVDFSTRTGASLCYGNAKRFLMFSLYGLFEGKRGLSVVHPGIAFTNITAHYPRWLFAIIKHPMKVIFMSPQKACFSILQGIFEDCGKNEWIGPRWFSVWGLPKKSCLQTCSEAEMASICRAAEGIYGAISAQKGDESG